MIRNLTTNILVATVGMFLYACNGTPQTKKHANWADSTFLTDTTTAIDSSNMPIENCFIHLDGSSVRKDSSFVNLSILGNKVAGKYCWIPFEKDSRTGSIAGIKKGDTIDVVWSFMQEGMKDTLRTVFLLQGNNLKQKPYMVNKKNGRQITNEQAAFTINYQKTNCD